VFCDGSHNFEINEPVVSAQRFGGGLHEGVAERTSGHLQVLVPRLRVPLHQLHAAQRHKVAAHPTTPTDFLSLKKFSYPRLNKLFFNWLIKIACF